MFKFAHRIIYFLLVTLMINVGGWTFNQEAVADVFLDAEQTAAVVDVESHAEQGKFPTSDVHGTCNHWCHAVSHFAGLLGHPARFVPSGASPFISQAFVLAIHHFPDSRFRPPRLPA